MRATQVEYDEHISHVQLTKLTKMHSRLTRIDKNSDLRVTVAICKEQKLKLRFLYAESDDPEDGDGMVSFEIRGAPPIDRPSSS